MARLTISLPDPLAKKATVHARNQKRSASSYVSLLIENDLRAAGLLPQASRTQAEDRALLQEADAAGIAWRPLLKSKIARA